MAKLFEPLSLRGVTLKNRIVMAPMCMFSAEADGKVTDWHHTHYTSRAVGGVGLIIVEATGVEARGRISNRDLGLWEDAQVPGFKRMVDVCHAFGAQMGIQLAHAGRKSEADGQPIAPSPLAFSDHYRTPDEMTVEDINTVVQAFKEGARRALEAGFDCIELHGAHGYLINEFLSPLTNHRTDAYGGNITNRARFLKEIVQAVRQVWPEDRPILVRVSAEDYVLEGNHPSDVANLLEEVIPEGIDVVHVSSGGVVNASIKVYPGYQITFAEILREKTGLPVIAGGIVHSPQLAEETLQNQRADLIFLGRELLRQPYWPLLAANELKVEVPWPAPYERGRG